MRILASGAMVAMLMGLAAGWAERPGVGADPVLQAPRLIVDSASEDGSAQQAH